MHKILSILHLKTYFFYFTHQFLQNTHIRLSILHIYLIKYSFFFPFFITLPHRPSLTDQHSLTDPDPNPTLSHRPRPNPQSELRWRASSQTQTPVGIRAPLSSSASGSGGSWISCELEAAEMKKQILQKTLEQIHSSSSSFILFSLQWKDLEDQFEGI